MGISTYKVLICDVSGSPHHWATMEDSITLKVKSLVSYEIGDVSTYRGGTQRGSGERSVVDVAPIVFLKEMLKYDYRIPPLTNLNLFVRDRHTCLYCARHYPDHKLSRDHIIPTSKGGLNIWSNVATACKICNHVKGDYLLHEIDMELLAIPYIPSHPERLIMNNKNILADQMDFLRAMLPSHSRLL